MISVKILGPLVLCLLVGFSAGYVLHVAPTTTTTAPPTQTIKIGGIFELSGSEAILGPGQVDAAQLAINEMNANLATVASPLRFDIVVQDSATTPDGAVAGYKTLVASGIQLIVGVSMSSELAQVIPLAAEDKVAVICGSSTSPALAIDKPYVFRMAGTDKFASRALASILNVKGYKNVVIIYRQDTWGKGLADLLASTFSTTYGGQYQMISYPATGYSMGGIAAAADAAVTKFGLNGTAVAGITFEDDGIALATSASSYPTLSSVHWIMASGLVSSQALLSNQIAANFLQHVGLLEIAFGGGKSDNPAYAAYVQAAKSSGKLDALESESSYIYDATMLGMQAILVAGNNGTAISAVLPSLAEHYNGITGLKAFDQFHDQIFQDWYVTQFMPQGGKLDWYVVGIYDAQRNTIEWYPTAATLPGS